MCGRKIKEIKEEIESSKVFSQVTVQAAKKYDSDQILKIYWSYWIIFIFIKILFCLMISLLNIAGMLFFCF